MKSFPFSTIDPSREAPTMRPSAPGAFSPDNDAERPSAVLHAALPTKLPSPSRRVLILDDEPFCARTYSLALSQAGFTVDVTDIVPVRTWLRGDHPRSHAEEAGAIQPGDDRKILIASGAGGNRVMIRQDFASIEEIGYISIPLGPTRERKFKLYVASGYHHVPRTAEFETKYHNVIED